MTFFFLIIFHICYWIISTSSYYWFLQSPCTCNSPSCLQNKLVFEATTACSLKQWEQNFSEVQLTFCRWLTNWLKSWVSLLFLIHLNHQAGLSRGLCRSSHQRCSIKKGVLKIFPKFRGKHPYVSLFLIKLRPEGQVFSCEFYEIFKNTFFVEHFWAAASANIFRTAFKTLTDRSSPSQMIFKIGVLKNFANLTGKHLCRSLFVRRGSSTGIFLWNLLNF